MALPAMLSTSTLSLLIGVICCIRTSAVVCNDDESKFTVDLFTDRGPTDTRWEIHDVNSNDILFKSEPFVTISARFIKEECVKENGCYEFTIYDSGGNGICCTSGTGSYKIIYEDNIIKQGGDFDFFERSPSFGSGCLTEEPSLSPGPTTTFTPSKSPTQIPSSDPTITQTPSSEPSTSSKPSGLFSERPSFAPTKTFLPTVKVTEFPEGKFEKDILGRRRFPPLPIIPPDAPFGFQPLPDCNDPDRLGCIDYPLPYPSITYEWAGKLQKRQPGCTYDENGRNKECDLNIPISNALTPTHLTPAISGFHKDNFYQLPVRTDERTSLIVEIADLDLDGNIDIIVGNDGAAPNQVHYNKGDGTFENATDLPGEIHDTFYVNAADLDSDGLIDIVCSNVDGPSKILWNQGDRVFEEMDLFGNSSTLPAGDVDFWDFNGDGELDIAIPMRRQTNVLLYNNGDRSFTETKLPGSENADTFCLAVGDMDANGSVDIIVGNFNETNEIIFNNGDGNFDPVPLPLPGGMEHTRHISIADINSDGFLDVILSNAFSDAPGRNQILWNDKDGNFIAQYLPGGINTSRNSQIGDVDGDGKLDIIFLRQQDPLIFLSYNSDNSSFGLSALPFIGSSANACAIADFDKNGLIDIVFARGGTGNPNPILFNFVDGVSDRHFSERFVIVDLPDNLEDTFHILTANLDGNQYPDLVFSNDGMNKIILSRDGSYSMTADLPGGSWKTSCIVLTHFKDDDNFDLFVGNQDGPNYFLLNLGNGTFEAREISNSSHLTTLAAASGDFNNDGNIDLVVGNNRDFNQVLWNNGNETFRVHDLPGSELDKTTSISLADMNNDTFLDIVLANGFDEPQLNYLLVNNGNETFDPKELPGGQRLTRSITIGKLHSFERLDIVVGNIDGPNQILNNVGNGNFEAEGYFDVKNLPGGSLFTNEVVLADMDADGDLDIIIANGNTLSDEPNQILGNLGNGNFEEVIIPNSEGARSLAVCNLDGDDRLDIIFGNEGKENTLAKHVSCQNGAQLHSQSWCFECPIFMGRPDFFGTSTSACIECKPDFTQSMEICNVPCPFGERQHGSDKCHGCPNGTYYNNNITREEEDPTTWEASRCPLCPQGFFTDGTLIAVNECLSCPIGTFKNKTGDGACIRCSRGTFQSERGQASCDTCAPGGYCRDVNTNGGGFTPCMPGTYNNKTGQSNEDACIPCEPGFFSTETGADSSSACRKCAPGSFSKDSGQTQCKPCIAGTSQPNEGSSGCNICDAGSYTSADGLAECSRCPARLGSLENSTSCEFCAEGYYFENPSTDISDIMRDPSKFCTVCPEHGICPFNTTLQTLGIKKNYWRDSFNTERLYKCSHSFCKGLNPTARKIKQSSFSLSETGTYCQNGYTGVRCEVCVDKGKYFANRKGCTECPSFWLMLVPFGVVFGIFLIYFGFKAFATVQYENAMTYFRQYKNIIPMLSLQAKCKIFFSFYQVMGTLDTVYGVRFHRSVRSWVDWSTYIEVGSLDWAVFSSDCLGNMQFRLILSAFWPVLIVLAYFIYKVVRNFVRRRRGKKVENIWFQCLKFSIIVAFFTLPSISSNIFDAVRCQSFQTSDFPNLTSRSYLLSDLSLECDKRDKTYAHLLITLGILIALGPVFVPLCLVVLFWKIKVSVESKQINHLAASCRFLWGDYNYDLFYWEIIDISRKLVLTCFIMFIDMGDGSRKITRLTIAIIVSILYLSLLLLLRPYKRSDDLYLAYTANFLLATCFVLGIIMRLCDSDSSPEVCEKYVGFGLDSRSTSILTVCATVGMVIITLVILIVNAKTAAKAPSIRLIHTGYRPLMELPKNCRFHFFVSHVWSTGQEKAHVMTRLMQKLLHEVEIWLDVDELNSIGDLEENVSDSTVFVLFYTPTYFRSRNCRREVYAAVDMGKPVIVLHEGTGGIKDEITEECKKYCARERQDVDDILNHLFAKESIQWLGSSNRDFAVESVKMVSLRVLEEVPFYKKHPVQLDAGLKVNTELGPVALDTSTTIIVSQLNVGALSTAGLLKSSLDHRVKFMNILELDSNDEDLASGLDLSSSKHYFLLYLNEDTFIRKHQMGTILKQAHELDIPIVLVHEQDHRKKACLFEQFFHKAPQEIIDSPYKIFNDVAVPLYPQDEYRKVSLRQILLKVGGSAEDVSLDGKQTCTHFCKKNQ